MANRRMISKAVIQKNTFLGLSHSAQTLYMYLVVTAADDEGFLNNLMMVLRLTNCTEENFQELVDNDFVILFSSDVVAIKHWCAQNQICEKRRQDTEFIKEKSQLYINEKKEYVLKTYDDDEMYTDCIQNADNLNTQYSIDKDSTDKDSTDEYSTDEYSTDKFSTDKREQYRGGESAERGGDIFVPPTLEEVQEFFDKHCITTPIAEQFYNYHSSLNWKDFADEEGYIIKDWQRVLLKNHA